MGNMDCKDEPYTLDAAGKITLLNYPHTDKSTSKCIAGALPLGVSLKSLTYDAAKHEVDISVGPIGLVVTAKCDDCAAAPAAAPAAAAAAPASRKLRGANRRYWLFIYGAVAAMIYNHVGCIDRYLQ